MLEEHNDLRSILGRPEGDFLARFPGALLRTDFEALYRRYGDFVSIVTNGESGVTTLDVKGFRAADAQNTARALLSYAEQLVNQMNERARRRLTIIETQINRMGEIIQRYLSQTRGTAPKSAVNINDLVRDTLVLLQPIFQQRGIEVAANLGDAPLTVSGNGDSIQEQRNYPA